MGEITFFFTYLHEIFFSHLTLHDFLYPPPHHFSNGSPLKAHANGHNIVGADMLRDPFAWNHNNVGTCCHLLRIV